jgi:DNA-binding transcriptional LysR family regulator
MTLEQLRIFIVVAEKQHVTQAAEQLNLTQSATSAAIAALESRYDVKLFDRVGRGIALTNIGRAFLDEAREVVAHAAAATRMLTDLSGFRHGSLSIAASQTVGNYWLPARLQKFLQEFPSITLHVEIANSERVAQLVRMGTANLGFVEGEIDDPLLSSEQIEGDSIVIVVGRNHSWAKRNSITPRDLPETDWVLRERGSGTRSVFESTLRGLDIDPSDLRIRMEFPSNEAIRSAVECGDCASAVSNLVVAQSVSAGTIHQVPITLPRRPFYILRHTERYHSKLESALLASLGAGSTNWSPGQMTNNTEHSERNFRLDCTHGHR